MFRARPQNIRGAPNAIRERPTVTGGGLAALILVLAREDTPVRQIQSGSVRMGDWTRAPLSLPGLFWIDLGDLVALDTESGHQPFWPKMKA